MSASPQETDQEPGAPHPRLSFALTGHVEAERMLADALRGDRMHHAWMITGSKGVGKATLSYRAARVALGAKVEGPRPLDVSPEDPIARRIAAGSHPDLFVLRRGLNERGKPRSEITVDEARGLADFFSLKPAEGGMRVAIIDCVDELNRNAANSILKTLEEPPSRALLLLVSHTPGAALVTIRSRCRRLPLRPLSEDEVAAAVRHAGFDDAAAGIAHGSPGRAIALAAGKGMSDAVREALKAVTSRGVGAFSSLLFEQDGPKTDRLATICALIREDLHATALARCGARDGDGDERIAGSAAGLAEAYADILALEQEAEGLDLDPSNALLRMARILERVRA